MYGSEACKEKAERNAPEIGSRTHRPGLFDVGNHGRPNGDKEHERRVCCQEFDVSCETILSLINVNPKFLHYAGTETVRAFQRMTESFKNAFNFTDARMFSPSMLVDMDQEEANQAFGMWGIKDVREKKFAVPPGPAHPFEEFARIGLARMSDAALYVERDQNNVVVNAYAVPASLQHERPTEPLQQSGLKDLEERIANAEAAAKAADERSAKVEQQLTQTVETIRGLSSASGLTMEEIRMRILEGINTTTDTTTETPPPQTGPKRPSKGRAKKTPEGQEGGNG
jgi:hypothetical protein